MNKREEAIENIKWVIFETGLKSDVLSKEMDTEEVMKKLFKVLDFLES